MFAPITQQYLKTHEVQLHSQVVCSWAGGKQGFIFQGDHGPVHTGRIGDTQTQKGSLRPQPRLYKHTGKERTNQRK